MATSIRSADELIHDVGRLLLSSEDLAGEWDAVGLGVILDGRNYDSAGFRYNADGRIVPIAPEEREFYDRVIELRDAMAAQTGKGVWLACLIQIKRSDMSIKIDFEYDDASRWKIGPANLAAMRESLRPR